MFLQYFERDTISVILTVLTPKKQQQTSKLIREIEKKQTKTFELPNLLKSPQLLEC